MTVLFHIAHPTPTGHRDIDLAHVASALGKVRIVDVREPSEFTGELGHIAGAELVPLATVDQAALGWDKHQEIVIVCRSGARSGRAATLLASMGFRHVVNMTGGMMAWSAAQHTVER